VDELLETTTDDELELIYIPDPLEILVEQRVLGDFSKFRDALYRKHEKFAKYYEYYYNARQLNKPRGQANVPVPLAAEAVDTIHADVMDKLFSTEGLLIDTMGREVMDENQASAIRDMIRYQCYEDNIRRKFMDSVKDCLICGSSVWKVAYTERYENLPVTKPIMNPFTGQPIDYEITEEEVEVYKGPTYIPVDIFDFFPHPEMKHIDDDLPVIHRFFATKEHLEAMERQGLYENVKYVKFNEESTNETEDDQNKQRRRRLAGVDDSTSGKDVVECYEWQGPFDIDGDGSKENCVLVVTKDGVVLRAEEMPYYDRKKTYCMMRIFNIPNELWGIGVVEKQQPMIEGANILMNVILDMFTMNVNSPVLVKDGFIDDDELVARQGQIMHVDPDLLSPGEPISTVFERIIPGNIAPDAYNLLEMFKTDGKNVTTVTDTKAGHVPSSKQTATAVQTAFTQASVRFKALLSMIEDSGLIPMCDKMQKINQQFIDQPYAYRIIGHKSQYWRQISPSEISTRVNFISLGSTRETDRAMNIQQLMQAINIFGGNPMLQGALPLLAIKLAEEFKLPNIELIKQVLQYEQQRSQVIQAMQMQVAQAQAQQGMMPQIPQEPVGIQREIPEPTNQQDLLDSMMAKNRTQVGARVNG